MAEKRSKNFYENPPYSNEPQIYQIGERVKIINNSPIWLHYCGEVTGFKNGLHWVQIDTKPSGIKTPPFMVEIPGSDLEVVL